MDPTAVLSSIGAVGAICAIGLAAATGLASALLPVVNAEAYALLTAARPGSAPAWSVVVALAVGQTAGKLVLFESARRGATAWLRRLHGRSDKPSQASHVSHVSRWNGRMTTCLCSRRGGPAVVLASATFGLPPLAAVSLAAGAAGQRRTVFALTCLVGRTARFAALAAPVIWAAR
jgi:membrane protein YqaA with SNARE-associated domain